MDNFKLHKNAGLCLDLFTGFPISFNFVVDVSSNSDTSSNKRDSTSSSTAGGNAGISVNKPKQVCLPLTTDSAQTHSSNSGSSMRKKKNRGMKGNAGRSSILVSFVVVIPIELIRFLLYTRMCIDR